MMMAGCRHRASILSPARVTGHTSYLAWTPRGPAGTHAHTLHLSYSWAVMPPMLLAAAVNLLIMSSSACTIQSMHAEQLLHSVAAASSTAGYLKYRHALCQP
jgi:hypothetical protein